MRRGARAVVVPPLLIIPAWLAAVYLATNVRTNCPSATLTAVLAGNAGCSAPLAYTLTHPTPWWGFNHVFGPLLLIALAVVPVIVAGYLAVRTARAKPRG